jgi:hypothetical protein
MLARSRAHLIGWTLSACVAGALLGCKDEEARPGALGDCNDDGCASTRRNGAGYIGGGNGTGSAGNAGSAAMSGNAGNAGNAGSASLPANARTLTGTIAVVTQADLTASSNLDAALKVRAPGANVAQVTTDAAQDGSFLLVGASSSDPLWVGIGAFDGDEAGPILDTLQPVAAQQTGPAGLLVVRRSVLEQIALVGFQVNPQELDPGRGSIILSVKDERGAPLPQVQLLFPAPEAVAVAYDAGDVYSDQATETSVRGTLVLLNVPASPYPGSLTSVSIQVRGAPQEIEIRTVAGGVSVVTAVVPGP